MICVNCAHTSTEVVNSRPHKKTPSVWRRRTCKACGYTLTTSEQPVITRLIHVRSSSTAEQAPFNPGKLTISIAEAFQHDRAHGRSVAWDLMQTTSGLLLASTPPLTPVSRLELAELTHTVLQRFDSRAAITYALQHHLDYTIKNKSANKH